MSEEHEIEELYEHYKVVADKGQVPLSYEVIYGHVFGHQPPSQRPQEVRVPLDQLTTRHKKR